MMCLRDTVSISIWNGKLSLFISLLAFSLLAFEAIFKFKLKKFKILFSTLRQNVVIKKKKIFKGHVNVFKIKKTK